MTRDFVDLLAPLPATARRLHSGATLFAQGDPVAHLHLVTEGEVHLRRLSPEGQEVILQRAGPGALLAEASILSQAYHCDAVASVPSRVLCYAGGPLRARLTAVPAFARAYAAHMAREVQAARLRAEILSLRTVRARLDAWLAWQGVLPPRGGWHRLAREIGVSPEALYREIARRRVGTD